MSTGLRKNSEFGDSYKQEVWVKFAAAALQGEIKQFMRHAGDPISTQVTERAAQYADAMMQEWEKR